ncbi:MAG: hypothetical protein LBG15_15870 [Dysgonamonadaceae bacterium]|jgi:hypothetical protein|nr:hypothetical protein [Dysgonamonadaceae bacterium]
MGAIAGIKYTKDKTGHKRYVRVDLDMYGENQLIEDFLDLLEVEARKGEPTYPLDDVIRELEKKHGKKFI